MVYTILREIILRDKSINPVPTFEKVMVPVPVPAPYLYHKKLIFLYKFLFT
jgi:hypothetical protein